MKGNRPAASTDAVPIFQGFQRLSACLKIAVFLLMPACLLAQKIDVPDHFSQLLSRTGIEISQPVDAGYRDIELPENEYLHCQFVIRSGRENLQIRYFVLPWDEADPTSMNPHLATFRALTSIASNADEAVISAIRPEPEVLLRDFNADWGMTYFFTPKPDFSDRVACKMLALCKEGRATVFVFFLFDEPGNVALDTRHVALRFL